MQFFDGLNALALVLRMFLCSQCSTSVPLADKLVADAGLHLVIGIASIRIEQARTQFFQPV